jgi:hypothetical protein
MRCKLLSLFIICLLPALAFAQNNSSYAMFGKEDNTLTISYNIDEQGQVFQKMLDIVRGGHVVEIEHVVSIFNKPGWRKKQLGRVLAKRFLSYDPLTDRFALSSTTRKLEEDLLPEEAAEQIFRLHNLSLIGLDELDVVGEYPVKIEIAYSVQGADKTLLDWVSFKKLWGSKTVKAEVTYIAR